MRWGVGAVGGAHSSRAAALAQDLGLADPIDLGTDGDAADRFDALVVVGDDHDLARAARLTQRPLLLAATGPSDVLRLFGLGDVPISERMRRGVPYATDLGEAASPVERVPFLAHVVASATARLPRPWSRRVTVALDRGKGPESHRASGVVVANAQHVAGAVVAPRSAMMDARLDLLVLGGSLPDRARWSRLVGRGLHLGSPGVHRRQIASVHLSLPPGWRLAADGTTVPGTEWEITVRAAACSLWV